jgi:hypothetical protein
MLYSPRTPPYVPRQPETGITVSGQTPAMRAETEKLVDEIKQAISLLRRHL